MERLGRMDVEEPNKYYGRQLSLADIGHLGQHKISLAKVLVIGAGGLGSPVIQYIVSAGIGHIGIVDNDTVSIGNLHRQLLYNHTQTGRLKVVCAKEYAERLNPRCTVTTYPFRLTDDNARELFNDYDMVVDCSDNLSTRYVIDKYTKQSGIPFVYGSLCEFEGKVAVFNYKGGTSYADLYPFDKDEVERFVQPGGIMGAFAGMVGTIQALEAIKLIVGKPSLVDKMLLINGLTMSFKIVRLK